MAARGLDLPPSNTEFTLLNNYNHSSLFTTSPSPSTCTSPSPSPSPIPMRSTSQQQPYNNSLVTDTRCVIFYSLLSHEKLRNITIFILFFPFLIIIILQFKRCVNVYKIIKKSLIFFVE